MAKVYSYIRFSSKKQEQGDSVRRQVAMGAAWMKRHPKHTLDTTLRLRDLGVSAFRGKNLDKDKGDLGKFIQLARDGRIAPGSILMVENLDRFSRQPTRKAYRVFCELVEAGVSVLTLDPEQMIDESNIDNMEVVLPVIIKMQLGYEESNKKSGRIAQQWEARRQRAMKDKTPMGNRCPSWLRWDDKAGKWIEKPGAKKTIAYIFKRTCEGIGQRVLVVEMRERFKPFGKRWNSSMISDILTTRTVLGELTPKCRGKRLPPIVGYYPRMIPDDLFYRARAASVARRTARGRTSKFVNLFVGRVRFADGNPAYIHAVHWTWKGEKKIKRRFISAGYREHVKGACRLSVDYWKVERYIMAAIYNLEPSDLFAKSNGQGESIKGKERELAGVELRLGELEKALTGSKQSIPALLTAIGELTAKRDSIKGQIENLHQQTATMTSKPVEHAQDIMAKLATKPQAEQHDLRLKLRGLIADIVDKIEIDPYRAEGQKVEARVRIHWKNSPLVSWLIDTGKQSPDYIADLAKAARALL